MINRLIRYGFYLAYFAVAALGWLAIFVLMLLSTPPHSPECHLASSCPSASPLAIVVIWVLVLSAMPLTAFGFIVLRSRLHRSFGGEPD